MSESRPIGGSADPSGLPPIPVLEAQTITMQALVDTIGVQRRTINHLVAVCQNLNDHVGDQERRIQRLVVRVDELSEVLRQHGQP